MSEKICPECEMNNVLGHAEKWECITCGHEWPREAEPEAAKIIKDANGNALADGDRVVLIKDLPLKGAQVLKGGSKTGPIRLVDSDQEISCKIEGVGAIGLKACFVRNQSRSRLRLGRAMLTIGYCPRPIDFRHETTGEFQINFDLFPSRQL